MASKLSRQHRSRLVAAALLVGSLVSGAAAVGGASASVHAASGVKQVAGKHKKPPKPPKTQPGRRCGQRAGYSANSKRHICHAGITGNQATIFEMGDDGAVSVLNAINGRKVFLQPDPGYYLSYYNDVVRPDGCLQIVRNPGSTNVANDNYFLLPAKLPKDSPLQYCKSTSAGTSKSKKK